MKICPKVRNICQSRFTILPNTKKLLKKGQTLFKSMTKCAKFRQIWSHCSQPYSWSLSNMGHARPLLVLFSFFSHYHSIINWKERSMDVALGIWTRGRRMVGADGNFYVIQTLFKFRIFNSYLACTINIILSCSLINVCNLSLINSI